MQDEERYLIKILDRLREEHAKAAQPYLARLAAIRVRENPPSIFVTVEQAQELGFLPPNAMLSGTETEPTTKRDA